MIMTTSYKFNFKVISASDKPSCQLLHRNTRNIPSLFQDSLLHLRTGCNKLLGTASTAFGFKCRVVPTVAQCS